MNGENPKPPMPPEGSKQPISPPQGSPTPEPSSMQAALGNVQQSKPREVLKAIAGKSNSPPELSSGQKFQELTQNDPDFLRGDVLKQLSKLDQKGDEANRLINEAYDRFKLTGSSAGKQEDSPQVTTQQKKAQKPKNPYWREEIYVGSSKPKKVERQSPGKTTREQGIIGRHRITSNVAHEILGVSSNATEDEVREAYRVLARRYHPDSSSKMTGGTNAQFSKLGEAKDALLARTKKKSAPPRSTPTPPKHPPAPERNQASYQTSQRTETSEEIRQEIRQRDMRIRHEVRDNSRRIHLQVKKEFRERENRVKDTLLRRDEPDTLVNRVKSASSINEIITILNIMAEKYPVSEFVLPGNKPGKPVRDILDKIRSLKTMPKAERKHAIEVITTDADIRGILERDLQTRDECFSVLGQQPEDDDYFRALKEAFRKFSRISVVTLTTEDEYRNPITTDLGELEESVDWFDNQYFTSEPEDVHRETLRVTHAYDLDLKMYYVIREMVWTEEMRKTNAVPQEIKDRYLKYLEKRRRAKS